jgi:hypothetical protein
MEKYSKITHFTVMEDMMMKIGNGRLLRVAILKSENIA